MDVANTQESRTEQKDLNAELGEYWHLPDDKQVTRFLSERNGRAWQSDISEGIGWSKAKTSQVLSEIEDKGLIARLRIGREKVVFLPDAKAELLSLSDTNHETQ